MWLKSFLAYIYLDLFVVLNPKKERCNGKLYKKIKINQCPSEPKTTDLPIIQRSSLKTDSS
jgi:hypothetical protein